MAPAYMICLNSSFDTNLRFINPDIASCSSNTNDFDQSGVWVA